MSTSPFLFPQDPPVQKELPFAIHQRATPNAPRGQDPQLASWSGMFPEDHAPIAPQLHKPSPSEFAMSVDPYQQTAQIADLFLQEISKDGQSSYTIQNPNQNVPYRMEPLVSNGDSARGNTFSMNYDQLEEYRKKEYTVELPVMKSDINPAISYVQNNDRYYPSPGFFHRKNPQYYTYPLQPNYYGTAPITSVSFGAVNPKRFYYENNQALENSIEKQFASPKPDAFLESFANLMDENQKDQLDPVECSVSVFQNWWILVFLLIFLCLVHLFWKK